jgi:hypothetical protein
MATIEINRGLRKADFHSADGTQGESSHASIEFARETPLPPGESVYIPLGTRGGRLRALIGVPQLLEKKDAKSSARREYLYRMGGLISEFAPEHNLENSLRGHGPTQLEDCRRAIM